MKLSFKHVLGVAALLAYQSSFALFGSGIVFDPSNFAKNTITSVQAVRDEINQLKQLEQQIKSNIASVRDGTNFGDTLNRVLATQQAASYLEQKIGTAQNVFTNAQAMYGSGNYSSWSEFGRAIQTRAQAGDARASSLIRSAELARQQMTAANNSHIQIAGTLSGVQGVTEAVQASTAATSILIDQQNAMLGLLSSSNVASGADTAKKQAKETAAETAAQVYGEQKKSEWDAYKARAGL